MLFGFSTGGGEVARYIGRHGTARVAKAGLISAVPPLMLKTPANPGGLPMEVFDGIRAASIADRSQLYRDLASGPFFGFNRPGAKPSQGVIDAFWLQGMMAGHKNALRLHQGVLRDRLHRGPEEVRRADAGRPRRRRPDRADRRGRRWPRRSSSKSATLKVYTGAPHGLSDTHKEQLNADLLAFLQA